MVRGSESFYYNNAAANVVTSIAATKTSPTITTVFLFFFTAKIIHVIYLHLEIIFKIIILIM